jgi:hypothetical protein
VEEGDSAGSERATGWDVESVILSVKLKVKEVWLAWTRVTALEVSLGLWSATGWNV